MDKKIQILRSILSNPTDFNITKDNFKYIHFKYPEWCCVYNPDPLFDDIKPFGWKNMISLLVDEFESKDNIETEFYYDIQKKIKNYKKVTQEVDDDDVYQNELLLNYVKCRPNIKVLTVFPINSNDIDFNDKYHVYAKKTIKLNFKSAKALVYQLFSLSKTMKNKNDIEKYVKLMGFTSDLSDVNIYIFEEKEGEIFNEKIFDDLNLSSTFCVCSTNFIESINFSMIYFNKNSLNLLNDMLLDRYLDRSFNKSRVVVNTLKKVMMVRKLTLLEQTKVIVLAGTVLASYGLRPGTDLDIYISKFPEKTDDITITKIKDLLLNKNEKLFFIDAYHPKFDWPEFWNEWHPIWANTFGAKNMLQCGIDPNFHYYFCGVKHIILEAEINRRNIRGRPAAVTDLIMINKLLNKNIDINTIQKENIKAGKTNIINPRKFIDTVKFWAYKKYRQKLTTEELHKLITFK
jgi:hypothetical protein